MSSPKGQPLDGLLVAVEICVNLNNFVNIELHSQGWYAVRVRALNESGVLYALPFGVVENEHADKPLEPRFGWQLDDEVQYRSRTFRIRYCLEEVNLGEAVHLYLYCKPQDFQQLTCTLEFELLFQITDVNKPNETPRTLALKPVAKELIRVQRFAEGIHNYLPITFDSEHLGLCNATLHSAVCGLTTVSEVEKQLHASRLAAIGWQHKRARLGHMYRSDLDLIAPLWQLQPPVPPREDPEVASSTADTSSMAVTRDSSFLTDGMVVRGASALYSSPPLAPQLSKQASGLAGSMNSMGSATSPSGQSMARSWSTSDVRTSAKRPSVPVVNTTCGVSWLSRSTSSTDIATTTVGRSSSVRVPDVLIKYLNSTPGSSPRGSSPPSTPSTETPTPSTAAPTPTLPAPPVDVESLRSLFDSTMGGMSASLAVLKQFIRQLPPGSFAPKTLESVQAMLAQAMAADTAEAGAATPQSTPGAALSPRVSPGPLRGVLRLAPSMMAAGSTTTSSATNIVSQSGFLFASEVPVIQASQIPESFDAFVASLPADCGVDRVVAMLQAVWQAMADEVQRNWAVLQWLLKTRASREMVRILKLQWEGRQYSEVEPWVLFTTEAGQVTDTRVRMSKGDSPRVGIEMVDLAAYRSSMQGGGLGPSPRIHKAALWDKPHRNPLLFVDASLAGPHPAQPPALPAAPPPRAQSQSESWAAVFVHGFQGAATDLCLVKAHMIMAYPKLECLSSKCNENMSHDSIQLMGERLAKEVADFLAPLASSTRRPLTRIMFVGHSIGNLIIRAALMRQELVKYHPQLWLYISISGPHLGSLYSSNRTLDLGMSVLKLCRSSTCLSQLTFSDAAALEDTMLYKLAMHAGLKLFKNIVVLTSPQDKYVPYHSARLSMCDAALRDGRRGKAYADMQAALTAGLGSPGGPRLFRIDVDFSMRKGGYSLSSWIGRTAHIEFIESDPYVHLVMWAVLRKYNILPHTPCAWV